MKSNGILQSCPEPLTIGLMLSSSRQASVTFFRPIRICFHQSTARLILCGLCTFRNTQNQSRRTYQRPLKDLSMLFAEKVITRSAVLTILTSALNPWPPTRLSLSKHLYLFL